jgi:hypothetical protein
MLASWALEIRIWTGLMEMLGGTLPYLQAARIWFLTAVVRYIPGNIWQPLSMTLYAQQQGVRPEVTVTSVLLYQAINVLAAGPIAAVYFWATGNWGVLVDAGGPGWATGPLLALMVLPVLLFLLLPRLLVMLLDWVLVRAKRPPLGAHFGRGRLLLIILAGIANWVLWGATFATLTFGLSLYTPAEMARLAPHLVFVYPIAYAIGFLSFLLPSGFGVREGALYVLLAGLMGGPMITVAALAMRIWNVLGEVVMALIAAFVGRPAVPAAPLPVEGAGGALPAAPASVSAVPVRTDDEAPR